MSRVIRVVDDDFKVIVEHAGANAGNALITLDTTGTNPSITGRVVVRGNLVVEGNTTTVESTNTTIADNTITLNEGETAAGITLNESGLEIDRGTLDNVRLVYDMTASYYNGGAPGNGSWVFKDVNSSILPINTNSINHNGTIFLTPTNGIVSVTGVTDYEENVLSYDVPGGIVNSNTPVDNDALVNAKALSDYVDFRLTGAIIGAISDADTSFVAEDFDTNALESKFIITVDGNNIGNIFGNRTEIYNLKFEDNQITTLNDDSTNQDLVLSASGAGSVRIDDGLIITPAPFQEEDVVAPSSNPPSDGIKLYSDPSSADGSGLFFVNSNADTGELISKNKALLYSMLF
jgi:hypothetical protein